MISGVHMRVADGVGSLVQMQGLAAKMCVAAKAGPWGPPPGGASALAGR